MKQKTLALKEQAPTSHKKVLPPIVEKSQKKYLREEEFSSFVEEEADVGRSDDERRRK